jgi:putative ABC transport system substrate-binding protein
MPIVFGRIIDPVGAGFVESLARPGGNASEFITLEYGLSAKWVGIPYQPLDPNEGKFGRW